MHDANAVKNSRKNDLMTIIGLGCVLLAVGAVWSLRRSLPNTLHVSSLSYINTELTYKLERYWLPQFSSVSFLSFPDRKPSRSLASGISTHRFNPSHVSALLLTKTRHGSTSGSTSRPSSQSSPSPSSPSLSSQSSPSTQMLFNTSHGLSCSRPVTPLLRKLSSDSASSSRSSGDYRHDRLR